MASQRIISTALALVAIITGTGGQADVKRTASGQPDLTGTYNVATLTPLQRPKRYSEKLTITTAEAEKISEYWARNLAKDATPSDPERDAPPEGGAEIYAPEFSGAAGKVGGYNAFYVDIGESNFKLDGEYRTSIITHPKNGRMPSLSAQGQQAAKALQAFYHENTGTAWWIDLPQGPYDDPELRPLAERCIMGFGSTSGPPALPVMYNNFKRVVQTDDHVVIINEMNHDARVIPIRETSKTYDMPGWLGSSVGHWEGDTLVIETQNFRDEPGLTLASRALKVTERLSRIDENTLRYAFTVNDPNWSEPWGGEYPWPATEEKMYEYACHEGNYALGGILRGARLLEEEALSRRQGEAADSAE